MPARLNGRICRQPGTFEVTLSGRGYLKDWLLVEHWLESDDNASGEYVHGFGGTAMNPDVRVWFTDEKTAIFTKLTWG
jgi:hypothetical protein